MNIDEEEINNKVKNLNYTINNLTDILNNIEKNIQTINNIYMNYEYNKNLNLNQTNTYLKFQVDLLNNEKIYCTNIKNLLLKKFTTEIYNLSENIIIILTTMNDLDIGFKEDKKKIFNEILKCKKQKEVNNVKIVETINITLNNLKQIKKFIDLFEKFIIKNEEENIKNNIHINSFKINLMIKKQQFELEYNKCLEQFKELINYFDKFCSAINKQQENQDILNFFNNNN